MYTIRFLLNCSNFRSSDDIVMSNKIEGRLNFTLDIRVTCLFKHDSARISSGVEGSQSS